MNVPVRIFSRVVKRRNSIRATVHNTAEKPSQMSKTGMSPALMGYMTSTNVNNTYATLTSGCRRWMGVSTCV